MKVHLCRGVRWPVLLLGTLAREDAIDAFSKRRILMFIVSELDHEDPVLRLDPGCRAFSDLAVLGAHGTVDRECASW